MYCYKCGKQLENDDNFCPYCGARVKINDESSKVVGEEKDETVNADKDYINDSDIFFGEKIKNDERRYDRVDAQNHQYQAKSKEANGMAIAGFVCAFIVPLLGLILSIIAYENLKKTGAPTKMATFGIIIAICSLVLSVVSNIFSLQLMQYFL